MKRQCMFILLAVLCFSFASTGSAGIKAIKNIKNKVVKKEAKPVPVKPVVIANPLIGTWIDVGGKKQIVFTASDFKIEFGRYSVDSKVDWNPEITGKYSFAPSSLDISSAVYQNAETKVKQKFKKNQKLNYAIKGDFLTVTFDTAALAAENAGVKEEDALYLNTVAEEYKKVLAVPAKVTPAFPEVAKLVLNIDVIDRETGKPADGETVWFGFSDQVNGDWTVDIAKGKVVKGKLKLSLPSINKDCVREFPGDYGEINRAPQHVGITINDYSGNLMINDEKIFFFYYVLKAGLYKSNNGDLILQKGWNVVNPEGVVIKTLPAECHLQ